MARASSRGPAFKVGFGSVLVLLAAAVPVSATIADSDRDRLDDAWETSHGLGVGAKDSKEDPDGDRLNNFMEYTQRSDPRDPQSPGPRVMLGARAEPTGGQNREQALLAFEDLIGRRVAVDRQFTAWDNALVTHQLRRDLENGWVPFVGWKAETDSGDPVLWADIAQGAYDGWIRHQADMLRQYGGRVILNFHHEPENDVGELLCGSPEDYRAAWQRVVTLFRDENADNVIFAFVLMSGSYANGRADIFYPGDGYVDYIGSNYFNFAPGKPGARWRPFRLGLENFYQWGVAHQKPLVIGAYGAQDDPTQPERRALWLRRAAEAVKAWPEIRMVVYFHSSRGYPWVLDTPSAVDAFREMAHEPYFQSFSLPSAR